MTVCPALKRIHCKYCVPNMNALFSDEVIYVYRRLCPVFCTARRLCEMYSELTYPYLENSWVKPLKSNALDIHKELSN